MRTKNIFLKIGYNTGIQILGKGISLVLSVFTIVMLTRYLGSRGYGVFTLAFTYVSFFSMIADFGLQLAMVRELAQKERKEKLYGTFLWLKIFLVLFSIVLGIVILFFVPYPNSQKIMIIIALLAISISGISNYGSIIFQSKIRLDLVTLIDIITKIATVFFIIVFVHLNLHLEYIISTVFLGNLIGMMVTYILIQDKVYFLYDKTIARQVLLYSIPIGISSFLSLAYFKIDTIMLSIMKNAGEVGLYSLAYKILENVLILWGFYMASVYPILAKLQSRGNKKEIKTVVIKSLLLALVGSIPIIIIGFLTSPFIITFFGGKDFSIAIPSLRILLFAVPFLFINNLFYNYFLVIHANAVIIVGMCLSLLFNILCNLYFIPLYGFIGASYVTVISASFLMTFYIIIMYILYREKL